MAEYRHGTTARLPEWLRRPIAQPGQVASVEGLLGELRLNTVCQSAKCPNRGECFATGTATFLIMGDACTRYDRPQHPYTAGLLASIPRLDLMRGAGDTTKQRLQEIKGSVPSLQKLPPGCAFAERCPHATPQCREASPPLEQKRPGHWAACWYAAPSPWT